MGIRNSSFQELPEVVQKHHQEDFERGKILSIVIREHNSSVVYFVEYDKQIDTWTQKPGSKDWAEKVWSHDCVFKPATTTKRRKNKA